MRLVIAPGVIYFDRAEWGANPAIRGGHVMNGAAEKTEVPIHHTVIVDNDATPDLWETEAEVKAKMRQLQVIRADITDVPYNAVIFLMANGNIIVCEGRGPNRSGAHTIGHNRVGYGVAFQGNMEALPNPQVALYVPKINLFFGWLKAEQLPRLSDFVVGHNHGVLQFFPHQDVSATACPGRAVIPQIKNFRYTVEEEDEMALVLIYETNKRRGSWWVTDWKTKRAAGGMTGLNLMRQVGLQEVQLDREFIDSIPDECEAHDAGGGVSAAVLAAHAADHDAHEGDH